LKGVAQRYRAALQRRPLMVGHARPKHPCNAGATESSGQRKADPVFRLAGADRKTTRSSPSTASASLPTRSRSRTGRPRCPR
jgi:hypothetical protein